MRSLAMDETSSPVEHAVGGDDSNSLGLYDMQRGRLPYFLHRNPPTPTGHSMIHALCKAHGQVEKVSTHHWPRSQGTKSSQQGIVVCGTLN